MKFTLDQIKTIIAEEVANVTKEAYGDEDPNLRMGYANKGRYEDPEDTQRRWDDNADLPPKERSGGSEVGGESKARPLADTIEHFFRKALKDEDFVAADFDVMNSKHYSQLKSAVKDENDENRAHLMAAFEANGTNKNDILMFLDWVGRGYGLPMSFTK